MGHLWNIRQFLNCARVQEFANNDDDQVTKTRVYAGIFGTYTNCMIGQMWYVTQSNVIYKLTSLDFNYVKPCLDLVEL